MKSEPGDSHKFDAMGTEWIVAEKGPAHARRVWITIQQEPTNFPRRPMQPQTVVLDADECICHAHDMLRRAARMEGGAANLPPEVLAALGALQNLADREEREEALADG